MQLPDTHIIPLESRIIATLVKKQILIIDPGASVILFGSRARGDAEYDSDWDFLVLTEQSDTDLLSDRLRKRILREVELKHDVAVSLLVKDADLWQSDYAVTNIYGSINEEGILL